MFKAGDIIEAKHNMNNRVYAGDVGVIIKIRRNVFNPSHDLLNIEWTGTKENNGKIHRGWYACRFRPAMLPYQQYEFNFMKE